MQRGQRGMTLIEIVIASAIVALLLPALLGGVWLMVKVVATRGGQLAVENRQQLARYWITRDANSADNFTAGSGITYGIFSWSDYTGASPAVITLTRTSQADFEAPGTVRVNLDTSTIPGDMFLIKGTTPAASFTTNVGPPAALGAGGHAIRRPNGTFLVIRGGGTTTTYIYDPVANSFSTGPSLTGSAGAGSNSFQRPDGKFIIIRAGGSSSTVIYDPVANTMTGGPSMTASAGAGSFTIVKSSGVFLILLGSNSTGTQIYTASSNSFAAGPTTSARNDNGAHAIERPDGKFLVYRGNAQTTTYIYDPVANSFAAGPSSGTAVGAGGHSLQRPDGKFLTIVGNNVNNTVIYDPVANSFIAGPAVASGAQVNAGAHSFERADGKWLIIKADAATNTAIYDPVNNTMAAGPATISNIAVGTTTIHRPNGTYLVIGATGAAAGSAYNAGFYISGQYNSEDFHPASIDYWTTIEWDKTADQVIVVKVRTAATQVALQTATFRIISSSGDSIGAGAGEVWLEVQIEYSRAMPSYPDALTEVWPTSGQTFYIRSFSQPDIQELRLNYNTIPLLVPYQVRYYYDSISQAVLREEKRSSVIVSVTQVAADILIQGDVSFSYDSAQKKITIIITPTVQEAPAIGDISRTATLVIFLRTAAQPVVPAP
ncbi:MAG: prepilin-type N-terminal cleavage/methylation domain-containing protein [Chloroflexi bacterium]|nr:prepilin-type N-terminal cleavage/methylation domain-containing protein [Chloroflexota bacterium]